MNQHQENRFTMFYTTQQVLDDNTAAWSGIPAISAVKDELDGNIQAIQTAMNVQVKDLKGYATAKAGALDQMIERTLRMSGVVMAYAEATSNAGLAEEMNIVPSELRQYRDAVVAQRCQGVHAAGAANIAALADYGIVAADVTDLQKSIDAYLLLLARPRTMVTARSVKTDDIGFLVRDTMRLLDRRLDMVMRGFMTSNPDFYAQYTKARIIIDQSGQGSGKQQQPVPKVA